MEENSREFNLICRVTHSKSEIDISGSQDNFAELATFLDKHVGQGLTIIFSNKLESPQPYSGFIKYLKFTPVEGLLQSDINDNTYFLKGNIDAMKSFIKKIHYLASVKDPEKYYHIHIEYYPEHEILSENFCAIVLTIDNEI
jgi:hypothetical protein